MENKTTCSEISNLRSIFINYRIFIARIVEAFSGLFTIILLFSLLPVLPFIFLMAVMLSSLKYLFLKIRNL